MRSLEMHIWGKNGWVQGSLAVQKSPLLKSRVLQLRFQTAGVGVGGMVKFFDMFV